eukprot:gene30302-35290_t
MQDGTEAALTEIIAAFDKLGEGVTTVPTYHMIGNHCLYNLPRATLNERLGLGSGCETGVSFYSASPHPSLRIIFADGYDVSILGWPAGHPLHEQARAILKEKNPNENKNNPTGLEGVDRRFVGFGGGLVTAAERIREQINWGAEKHEARPMWRGGDSPSSQGNALVAKTWCDTCALSLVFGLGGRGKGDSGKGAD